MKSLLFSSRLKNKEKRETGIEPVTLFFCLGGCYAFILA